MGRRAVQETIIRPETASNGAYGETSAESRGQLTSAQRLSASSASLNELAPGPFEREGKHFTEIRVLNRDVCIVLEGINKFNDLIGLVYYPDGESAKDLALELVEHGLAKYIEWNANMLEDDVQGRLKSAKLEAKKVEDLDELCIASNFQLEDTFFIVASWYWRGWQL